jgi:hypothetical protein
MLVSTKGTTAITAGSQITITENTGNQGLDRQYVSAPMTAGTVFTTGVTTVAMQIMMREISATDDVNQCILSVRVVDAAGTTVRATLLAVGNYGPATEFATATTHRNKTCADGDTVAATYTTVAGDRLVVEVGYQTDGADASPVAVTKWGDNSTDLPVDETQTTDGNGWIEFSNTFTFVAENPAAALIHTCSGNTASLVCTLAAAPAQHTTGIACIARNTSGATQDVNTITQTNASWVQLIDTVFNNPAQVEVWYAQDIGAAAGTGVTIAMDGAFNTAVVLAFYTGLRLTGVVDASVTTATGTSSTPASTAIASGDLDQAANLLAGCIAQTGMTGTGNNFTLQSAPFVEAGEIGLVSNAGAVLHTKIISLASETAGVSATSTSSAQWVAAMTAWKILPLTQTLTIAKGGQGKGRVTSSPLGIACGVTCNYEMDDGQAVTLTAEPVADSYFSAWSGDADCSDGVVTMSAARNCTATFNLKQYYALTVTKAGAGTGLVRSSGKEIDCGSDCYQQYIDGAIEWVNAYPAAGSTFAGWSGTGCTLTSARDGSVAMTQARTCTATFNLQHDNATAGASDGQLFHVRTDGSNANCTGLVDALYDGVGGPDPCAFLTVAEGVNSARGTNPFSCANGDDVRVHGSATYAENVTMPSVCQCPDVSDPNNGPCIIQGDSAATIIDAGAGAAAITAGNSGGASRARWVMYRDMRLKAGTAAGFRCGTGLYCSEATLLDVTVTDMAQFTASSPPDAAIQFDASFSSDDGNLLDGVIIDGDETNCVNYTATNGARICGTTNGYGVYAGSTSGIDIRNTTIRDIQGQAGRSGSFAVIQDNEFRNIACADVVSDDGCWQLYNHKNVVLRRNLFDTVGAADNSQFGVIRMRRTQVSGGSSATPPGMTVYGNTFAMPRTCSGTTSACASNSWGIGLRRNGILSSPDGSGEQRLYGEFNIVRNVITDYTSTTSQPLFASSFTGGGVNVCPGGAPGTTTIVSKGNVFFNNDTPIPDYGTCTTTLAGYDATGVQVAPGLDASFDPTAWAEACFPQGSSFTAADGDVSDGWVGQSSGACLAITALCSNGATDAGNGETDTDCGGVNCPKCINGETCAVAGDCQSNTCTALVCVEAAVTVKAIVVIISKLGPAGAPPGELWQYSLAPGEIIGIWERP